MNKITIKDAALASCMALLIVILIIVFMTPAKAQATKKSFADTIYCNKIRVPYNGLINKKTGKIEKIWYRKVKVYSGYITREKDSTWIVNGREVTIKM